MSIKEKPELKMNELYKKILAVMKDVGSVVKDKKNEFHKYMYASDEAIITKIRDLMIKHQLIAIPNQKACTQEGDLTRLTVEYKLIDVQSGQYLSKTVHGYGQDKGDKGAYKAATGAEKYFFLKTFLIPTTDDPEKENGKKAPASTASPEKQPPAKDKPLTPLQKANKIKAKKILATISAFNSVDVADEWFRENGQKFRGGFVKATVDFILKKFNEKHATLMKEEGGPE